MYSYEFDEELKEGLRKLVKKDKPLFLELQKKVVQIAKNPLLGKPLRNAQKPFRFLACRKLRFRAYFKRQEKGSSRTFRSDLRGY